MRFLLALPFYAIGSPGVISSLLAHGSGPGPIGKVFFWIFYPFTYPLLIGAWVHTGQNPWKKERNPDVFIPGDPRLCIPKDPRVRWCEDHLDALRGVGDAYAAIDADRGVVISDADQERFSDKLRSLRSNERAKLLVIHTSQFLHGVG